MRVFLKSDLGLTLLVYVYLEMMKRGAGRLSNNNQFFFKKIQSRCLVWVFSSLFGGTLPRQV